MGIQVLGSMNPLLIKGSALSASIQTKARYLGWGVDVLLKESEENRPGSEIQRPDDLWHIIVGVKWMSRQMSTQRLEAMMRGEHVV